MKILDDLIVKLAKNRGLDSEKELTLLTSIINALPDMLWAKGPDGSYIYANKSIIEKLLFTGSLENTVNRRDGEIALDRKNIIGDENHTFGQVCGNSDYVILDTEEPERFLEYGKVSGEDMYLEVHKDILKDCEGNIMGTVGTGRDVTKEYKDLKKILDNIEEMDKDQIKNKIEEIINKYWYAG